MTTLDLTTRLVTVPKHRDSLTHAIEKAGLDYVSTVVSCYDARTGLTDVYEITGIPRHDDDGRCVACSQTAARCESWGKPCCPVCVHQSTVSDDDLNRLDVTLTADQYILLQVTLRRAQTDPTRTSVHSLEIERLITIFAEAAAPPEDTT